MQVKTCPWCGNSFVINDKERKRAYCCRHCSIRAAQDNILFSEALQSADSALRYYKSMLRKIVNTKATLWESISTLQWERLIMLHDSLPFPDEELQNMDKVVDEVLAMPALQRAPEETKRNLKLYCKNKYPEHRERRK